MAQIAELEVAFTTDTKRLNDGIASVKKGVSQTGAQITKSFGTSANKSIEGTTMAVTNFNRIVQDAPYGIIGISNNLEPMIQSFNQLKGQTGSTTRALKTLLVSAFTGPGALITAVSLGSTLLLTFGDRIFGAGKKADEAGPMFDGMKEAVDGLLSSIAEFDTVTGIEGQIKQTERALETYKSLKAELETKVDSAYTEAFRESNFFMQNTVRDGVEKFNALFGTSIKLSEEESSILDQIKKLNEEITQTQARLNGLKAISRTETARELELTEKRREAISDISTEILKGNRMTLGMNQAVSTLIPATELVASGMRKVAVQGSLAEIALRGVQMEVVLSEKVGQTFVNTMTNGLATMITQTKTLGDGLRMVGKMLLQAALQMGIVGFLTGGLTTGAGFFGKGGGLFGSIGKLFTGGAMGASPAMDRSMALTGQFTVSGQDLQLVLDRANQFSGRG